MEPFMNAKDFKYRLELWKVFEILEKYYYSSFGVNFPTSAKNEPERLVKIIEEAIKRRKIRDYVVFELGHGHAELLKAMKKSLDAKAFYGIDFSEDACRAYERAGGIGINKNLFEVLKKPSFFEDLAEGRKIVIVGNEILDELPGKNVKYCENGMCYELVWIPFTDREVPPEEATRFLPAYKGKLKSSEYGLKIEPYVELSSLPGLKIFFDYFSPINEDLLIEYVPIFGSFINASLVLFLGLDYSVAFSLRRFRNFELILLREGSEQRLPEYAVII